MNDTIAYLSKQWISEAARLVAGDDELQRSSAGLVVTLAQLVRSDDGDIEYCLRSRDGVVELSEGAVTDYDIRIAQSRTVAASIASGQLNAQQAFINGDVKIEGDPQHLIEAQTLLGLLDDALRPLRSRTTF